MKVRKVVRRVRTGDGGSSINAVVAATIGEPGGAVGGKSTQHVEIVQRGGRTEVREHREDKEH